MIAERQMTVEELLAVFIAREMRDFETCACGAQSFIPAAGMLLGRELYAPNMEIIIRGNRHFNPIVESRDFHFLAQRGKMDLFFIGAIEIDKRANFNLHAIGDRDAPQVLMPGQYGTGLLYYAVPRIIMFRTAHTKRIFVERVHYVSGAGTSPQGFFRRTKEVKILTPIAWLKLNHDSRVVELASVHPDHTAEQVQENTGFDLNITGPVPTTPAPTETELHSLKTVVKSLMIETGTYADLARTRIGVGT
jgi:glutaconate CoA-transferase subunit B